MNSPIANDIFKELTADIKAIGVCNIPYSVQQIIILGVISSYWLSYNSKSVFNQKPENLALNIVIRDATTPFLKDVLKIFKLFPQKHIFNSYDNIKDLCNSDYNFFALFDLCDLDSINKELRKYKILGTFSDKIIRKKPFASLIFTNESILENEFDLSLTTTFFSEKNTSIKNKINVFDDEQPSDNYEITSKWNSFFEDLLNQNPIKIILSEDLKSFLRSEKAPNYETCTCTLKFLYSYILLKNSSLEPIKYNDGIRIFEATKEYFNYVLELIWQTKSPINQLPRISIEILNLIAKKYNTNSSFTRKDLLKDTGWSPAKLSDALKPLEYYEILPCKKEGSSHQKSYKYISMFNTDINFSKEASII